MGSRGRDALAGAWRARLRPRAIKLVNGALGTRTHSETSLAEARRELLWWATARIDATKAATPSMLRASGLCCSYRGYVEMVALDVPGAGRGQVTVRPDIGAVNVGTERAQYLKLPNAMRVEGSQPRGALAGVVIDVGRGVNGVSPGQRVAVISAPHCSVVTVPAAAVLPIADGTTFAQASLVHLALIAGQGVRLAGLTGGERFGVVGAGIIGALAQRLAIAEGAMCEAAVARSRTKEALALAGGARAFLTSEDDALESLDLPVVFEVTGDPQALATAVRMAAPGGRIVLLGSSRGITRAMPVGEIRAKGLTLVGAHVDTIRRQADAAPAGPSLEQRNRDIAGRYLERLASGALKVDDLITTVVDPREAAAFFRALVDDSSIVGAVLDWTLLPDAERVAASNLLVPPDLSGRGVDFDEPPDGRSRRRRSTERPAPFPDPFANASGDLRVGMLGCGDISVHNAAAIAAAPNARLVACFDPDAQLAEDVAGSYGAEQVRSAEALAGHPDVDAVFIAVPHHLHEPLALMAIEAGKHVVVEKPLSTDVRSALSIAQAAEDAGITLSTCFPQRYDPAVLMSRHLIEQGALGELGGTLVRVMMDKSPAYWYGGFSGRAHSTWRSSRDKAGGGVLIMNSCHYVDIVRHLAGVEVESVTSLSSTVEGEMEVEDSIALAMRYRNGAIGSLVASSVVRGTNFNEVELWGRDGHLVLEPNGRIFTLRHVGGLDTTRWQPFTDLPAINSRAAYVSRLATTIDRGEAPDVTAHDGVVVQAIIEAAYRSEGAPVDPGALLTGLAR